MFYVWRETWQILLKLLCLWSKINRKIYLYTKYFSVFTKLWGPIDVLFENDIKKFKTNKQHLST